MKISKSTCTRPGFSVETKGNKSFYFDFMILKSRESIKPFWYWNKKPYMEMTERMIGVFFYRIGITILTLS